MENDQTPVFSVSDFVASTNQTLEYAYQSVLIEGEVESFKVSQNKFVFFNLKDTEASVGCFMMVYTLRIPLEDGMRVAVRARPKLTNFGKFSLTVETIKPVGEGSIKKGFELLKSRLEKEGLFSVERKRVLPKFPRVVGVISSTQSAGFVDFMKIADQRWGGIEFKVYHTLVQGLDAPDSMMTAIRFFNQLETPLDALVIVRGGGSADDLAAFNDEGLVREIAASRTPTLVGVGHEIDTTLSDMVADVRAATPSNAAQLLLPDKQAEMKHVDYMLQGLGQQIVRLMNQRQEYSGSLLKSAHNTVVGRLDRAQQRANQAIRLMQSYDPSQVLRRGYALIRGDRRVGGTIEVDAYEYKLTAKVQTYEQK